MKTKRLLLAGLLAVSLGASGCTDPDPTPPIAEKPNNTPAITWQDVLKAKPSEVPGEELYSDTFTEEILREANERIQSFDENQLPKEVQPIYQNMLREAELARASLQNGDHTIAMQHAAQAKAYARGFRYYMDFTAAPNEDAALQVTRRLEELAQEVERDRQHIRALEATVSTLGDYLLVTVMEKQIGADLLEQTRTQWQQVSGRKPPEDLLLAVFMNIGVLENQRERLQVLLQKPSQGSKTQTPVKDRLRPWLHERLDALQAAANEQKARFSDPGTQAYRALQNTQSQVEAAQEAMTQGRVAYALELYWSAQADLETAPHLLKITTQGARQKQLAPAELADIRGQALQELNRAASELEAYATASEANNPAWFSSKLKGARADLLAGDERLQEQSKAPQANPVAIGEAYRSYVKSLAAAQIVSAALDTNRALQQGNLESLP